MEAKLDFYEQKIVNTYWEIMQHSKNERSILQKTPELACQMMVEAIVTFEFERAEKQGVVFEIHADLDCEILVNLERLFLSTDKVNREHLAFVPPFKRL